MQKKQQQKSPNILQVQLVVGPCGKASLSISENHVWLFMFGLGVVWYGAVDRKAPIDRG